MSQQAEALMQQISSHFESQVPDKTVRLILEHSLELFAHKGLHGTRISDIAAHAGFSQGFVYNYFKTKEDIFAKIVEVAVDGAEHTVRAAAEMDGTPRQRMGWLTEAMLSPDSMAMQHWRFISLQATMSEACPEQARHMAAEGSRRTLGALLPIIAEGQQAGEFSAGDPVMLGITYFAFVQGLGIMRSGSSVELPFPSVDLILSFLTRE